MKTTFHFVKAQDSVDMDVNTNQEMTRVKEHFGKLKMTYLQLETKQLMLESIATDGVLNTVNQTEIKALEQTVARGKKALRSVKMNIKEVRGEVQELLVTLADSKTLAFIFVVVCVSYLLLSRFISSPSTSSSLSANRAAAI